MSRKVQFAEYSFPQLKELIVPKLQNISAFVNDAKNLTRLKVDNVTHTLEFFSFDFSSVFVKLKRLRECKILVRTINCHQYGCCHHVYHFAYQVSSLYSVTVW